MIQVVRAGLLFQSHATMQWLVSWIAWAQVALTFSLTVGIYFGMKSKSRPVCSRPKAPGQQNSRGSWGSQMARIGCVLRCNEVLHSDRCGHTQDAPQLGLPIFELVVRINSIIIYQQAGWAWVDETGEWFRRYDESFGLLGGLKVEVRWGWRLLGLTGDSDLWPSWGAGGWTKMMFELECDLLLLLNESRVSDRLGLRL